MKSRRKIWSLPLVLVTALLLVGLLAASVMAQASRASVPASLSVVAPRGQTDVVTYKVSNYTPLSTVAPVPTTGASNILAVDVDTTGQINPDGMSVPMADNRLGFAAEFTAKADQTNPTTDETRFDRIAVTSSSGIVAGTTYTLRVAAKYDTNIAVDVPDRAPGDAVDDIGWTGDTDPANDQDGELVTILTVHVPVVATPLQFQAESAKVVRGELISRVGRDRDSNPLAFEIKNMGPGTAKVERDSGVTAVKFELSGGNKVLLRADTNNVAATAYAGMISIDRGDHDLNGMDTDNAINIPISANVNAALPLAITDGTDAITTSPHYEVTIPETTAPGTGVLAYYVSGASGPITGDIGGTVDVPEVPAEKITGVIGGDSASLFRVNNDTMAIEYAGPANGLTAGDELILRLTASGDRGLANRLIVGMVEITIADVDSPPMDVPEILSVNLVENNTGEVDADGTTLPDALVTIEDDDGDEMEVLVMDFAGVGNDPEGRTLSFRVAAGTTDFKFEGTKLLVAEAIGAVGRGDNPATTGATETETDWPVTPPTGWAFAPNPPISLYPTLTRELNVIVSDGVPSNDQTIAVTITLSVNAPVAAVGTLADQEYETTDVQNHEIVDLNDYVTGSDSRLDEIDFVMTLDPTNPPFGEYDGSIRVNYPGPTRAIADDPLTTDVDESWDPEEDGWTIRVFVGDAFENGSGPELCEAVDAEPDDDLIECTHSDLSAGVDAVLDFTIKQIPGPPLQSYDLVFEVDENAAAGTVVGSLGPEVDGAVAFSVISGTGNARDDFAVNETTGEITVINGRDYDAVGAENNIVLLVDAFGENGIRLGAVIAGIAIQDIDEDPVLTDLVVGADGTSSEIPWVYETAQIGDPVVTKPVGQEGPAATDADTIISAMDPEGADITYSISSTDKVPFAVDSSTGALTVTGALDRETAGSHTFTVKAADPAGNYDEMEVTVHVLNSNETPQFTSPTGDSAVTTIPENTPNAHVIFTFTATDEDGDDLTFTLREGQSRDLFVIEDAKSTMVSGVEVWSGELHVKTGVTLDFEDAGYDPRVHVEANDPEGLNATLLLTVNLSNVNDNDPVFDTLPAATSLSVPENTARGFVLANYSATDADGETVMYNLLAGGESKSFEISPTGDLMTLESLDADRQVPCGASGCSVTVEATDGERNTTAVVTITVTALEDSVSTLGVTKANPVPGTESGHPTTALAGTKTTKVSEVPERPGDLPNTGAAYDVTGPVNFVESDWANWGTILRIEVTAESPAVGCGNGNQCVVIDVNSDSADTSIKLEAYRSATQENKFVAALMLVELSENATDSDSPAYAHSDGSVARIKVDEEDEIEIEFGNLRGSLDVENEDPEISNFAPDHEAAFDDSDVDYTFTVTDSNSGMPEPEDLPDVDGDENYTPVVALISTGQCETHDGSADTVKVDGGTLSMAASINEDESLYCPGTAQDGEYDASGGGFGFAPIRDDRDFDEIEDGFDVKTTIVLRENKTYFVTFIACDNAGNCSFYDPDGNDDAEELAQITVDTEDPVFVEARTGLTWDSTDNEYDDNRSFIQVIFNDLTTLNTETVEIDDFVVEGHTISDVHIFENPDDDDVDWADSGRYGADGHLNKRGIDRYRDLENVVFIELADELLADETPDVTIVPNGVEDAAGNEQDDGDHEADDWISPSFTVVSIVSTRETSQDEILAGDDDEVTVVVTTDERLDSTRPTVTVTYVNAPAGSIDTKGIATCDTDEGADEGTRDRGEIVNSGDCADSGAATGGNLNNSVEKVSNTEWIVTITEPKDTGYYNFRISGKDRSPQENPGSEGVSPSSIVTDFFDADGDVNVDDAIFFEGDVNLPKPNVRVSGVSVEDNEADVEFRSPLFVELDFAANHSANCRNVDSDEEMANCMNENSEYAEDNFDDIVVTSFVLDGVDLTDSVKTTDNQSFLVSLESISIGDHTATVQAVDQAGNVFEDTLEIDFEVNDRDPFEKRLSPGWNLVSLPGEPADSSIASVFGPGVEVRTVYSYDPVIPGGWQVAVRETLDSDWQGDLTEITGQRGYWVLSDAIQDWEVSIPRLAGGASGTGTPIQPPVIPMYAGWNLIPVTDVSGNALSAGIEISAEAYLNSLDDGLDLARVLGYDTIRNEWFTVLDKQMGMVVNANLRIGAGYWVFVREAAALVPGGIAGVGGSD